MYTEIVTASFVACFPHLPVYTNASVNRQYFQSVFVDTKPLSEPSSYRIGVWWNFMEGEATGRLRAMAFGCFQKVSNGTIIVTAFSSHFSDKRPWGEGASLSPLASQWEVKVKSLSRGRLFVTPWTVTHQAPPSMRFSRQEYWRRLPFPSQGDLPGPGIEPRSPALQADTLTSEPPEKPWIYLSFLKYYWTFTISHYHHLQSIFLFLYSIYQLRVSPATIKL